MVSFPDLPSFSSPIQIAVPHTTGTQDILWVRALRVIRRVLTAFRITGRLFEIPRKTFLPLSSSSFRVSGERVKGGRFCLWVLRKSCRTEHPLNCKARKISAVSSLPPEAHGTMGESSLEERLLWASALTATWEFLAFWIPSRVSGRGRWRGFQGLFGLWDSSSGRGP